MSLTPQRCPPRLLRGRTRCCGAEGRERLGGLTFSSRHSSGSRRSAASASHRLRSRIRFSSRRVAAMAAPELASAPSAILGRGAGRGGKRRAGRDRPAVFKKPKNLPQIAPNPTPARGHRGQLRLGAAGAAAVAPLSSSLTPAWPCGAGARPRLPGGDGGAQVALRCVPAQGEAAPHGTPSTGVPPKSSPVTLQPR